MYQPFSVSTWLQNFLEATNTKAEEQFQDHYYHEIKENTCFNKGIFARK